MSPSKKYRENRDTLLFQGDIFGDFQQAWHGLTLEASDGLHFDGSSVFLSGIWWISQPTGQHGHGNHEQIISKKHVPWQTLEFTEGYRYHKTPDISHWIGLIGKMEKNLMFHWKNYMVSCCPLNQSIQFTWKISPIHFHETNPSSYPHFLLGGSSHES